MTPDQRRLAVGRAGGDRRAGARKAQRAGWTGSRHRKRHRTSAGGSAPDQGWKPSHADAERDGELRARQQLSGDVLGDKRKREADREYEQAIGRAGRLGLSHREIAAAAEVSHGTVRAILTRATASLNGTAPQATEQESTASDDIAQ